jgi:phosphohistidine phosphatase
MLEPLERRLILLRHAQAEGRPSGMDDRDRRLSAGGRGELLATAQYLRRLDFSPEAVIVSGAWRALETWDVLSKAIGLEIRPIIEDTLYLAPPMAVLSRLQSLGATPREILVIGHNPGLTSLARSLAGPGSDRDAVARLGHGLDTGALACFETTLADWSDLTPGGARLVASGS